VTPHQILIVGIRLLAVVWFLSILWQVAGILIAIEHGGIGAGIMWAAAGVQLLFCAFMWLFPATLASKLLRGGMESVSAGSVPFYEWRDLCFVSVGTFVLARAVPTAIYWMIVAVGSGPEMEPFTFEQKASLLWRCSR
jgi:hypothetical protein